MPSSSRHSPSSSTENATGLILRVRPLTETSLIVHWLTPELGRVATVAKGARRNKSPFRGKLDLFYRGDFSFVRSRRSDLHTLREVSLRETNEALRTELGYLQQAAYCATLIEQTTETETPLPGVYDLMDSLLRELPHQPPQPVTIFAFEMKLLHELGQAPDLTASKLTPGAQKILTELTVKDWPALHRLKLSAPQTQELQHFLHGFIIYHLERIPTGRAAALNG
jgi:DNA repair protein RecO (recombination protein O)